MTVVFTTNPSTADLLLFGESQRAVTALSKTLDAQRVLDSVGEKAQRADSAFQNALKGKVAEAGGELLSALDLGALLLGGWQKYRELRAAARRTVERPGGAEMVRLAEHTITSRHAPYVDVFVDGRQVARVTFGIDLEFTIALLQAGVRGGRLISLGAGACTASITWSVQGVTVARNEAALSLPLHVRLGEGILLYGGTPQRS